MQLDSNKRRFTKVISPTVRPGGRSTVLLMKCYKVVMLRGKGAVPLLALACGLLLASCGGSSHDVGFGGSAYPNGDLANTRHVGGPIDSGNVSQLKVAWTLPLKARSTYGSYSASPVVSEDVVYSQDLQSNVEAIELESGRVLWSKGYELEDLGPNGVAVAGGHVYGGTPLGVFALNQRTGREIWSTTLVHRPDEGIDMAPGVYGGAVYISTVPGTATGLSEGGSAGTLWALAAKTGRRLWHFDTVPAGLWGNPGINTGGGVWNPPAFDEDGSMYVGVGNPASFPKRGEYPWGSSRPGPNLYTDSVVELDAKTGKPGWHYQLTPHDLYDWDLQDPPILTEAGGRKMLLAAGKAGIVLALDPRSGGLVWRRPVGTHNGHDEDGLYAMRHEYGKLKPPFDLYPGSVGGVIAPMSTNGRSVFVPVTNHPLRVQSPWQTAEAEGARNDGEVVALDVRTGAIEWRHEFSGSPVFGATSSVNDVVFTTTYDGHVYALEADSGKLLWQEALPAGTNTGVTVAGDTVIAPAGVATSPGQTPKLVAYRLGG